MNKVILLGNLTRDPELRHVGGNTAVCSFGIAHNRKWKNKSGEPQEEVLFVDCTAWEKTAELIAQHFTKGRQILIEGRLRLETWEDKGGGKRSKVCVVVDSFHFTGSKEGGAEPARKAPARVPVAAQNDSVDPDDIPF